jgi:hypothetical protein
VPPEPPPAADLPRTDRVDHLAIPGRQLVTLDESPYPSRRELRRGTAEAPDVAPRARRSPGVIPAPTWSPVSQPIGLPTGPFTEPIAGPVVEPVAEDEAPTAELKARDVETAAPPRRGRGDGVRRRDLRIVARATDIVRRDRRRRLVAGGTLLAVLGMIVIPSMVNNVANAEGISSGTMPLRPGMSGSADSGVVLAQGTVSTSFTIPKRPAGGSLYIATEMRASSKGSYRAKVRVYPDGQMNVGLSKIVGGSESLLGARLLGAKLPVGGATINIQGAVGGNDPSTLRVRAWLSGMSRPDWQYSTTDATPQLVNGSVRAWSFLSAGATAPLTVTFKNLGGVKAGTAPAPGTQPSQPASQPSASATPTKTPSAVATVVKPKPSASATTAPGTGGGTSPGTGTGGGGSDSSTGVPEGTKLKVHSGDLVVTRDGATYDGLDIRGFVDIRATDVTIRNSLIRGGVAGNGNRGVVNVTDTSARRFVLENSEVRPANPSVRLDGINGANFTLRRVEIDGGVDAAKIFGDNVKIESSWLHGTQRFSSDPNQGGKATHNDAIQMQGGTGVSIKNSRIEGGGNAGIMVTQDFAATKSLTISGNRLSGGSCTVNIVPSDLPSVGPVTLTDNVFVPNSTVSNCPVARTASTKMTASGNTLTDGSPATINVWN